MADIAFPEGFEWGASMSGYQTEGQGENTDWWLLENKGGAPASGRAADSWNRWRDDLDIACELGLTTFRISTEWARVEPENGTFDLEAVEHYAEVLREAKRRGLKTMVVLWHFTNPAWLAPGSDWVWYKTPSLFERYARLMAQHLGGLVDHWATINEADTYVWRGYIVGEWPPERKDAWQAAYLAYRGFAAGHKRARRAIKDVLGNETPVGLTHLLAWPHAAQTRGRFSAGTVMMWNLLANDLFLNMVAKHTDWLGVQYYHDSPAHLTRIDNSDGSWPHSDMGWRIVPEGLYEVVMRTWRRYRIPMMVTENGLADAADAQRARFIIDHLAWLHRAISEGADVRGYLHWSLIDNFEWSHGFGPRFGLAEVDYETFSRTIRPSARIYAQIIAANGIPGGLGDELTYADGSPALSPK